MNQLDEVVRDKIIKLVQNNKFKEFIILQKN